jgi:uncharacterized protein (DUF58 family)
MLIVKSSMHMRSWGLVLAVLILLALQAFAPTPVVMMCLLLAAGLLVMSFSWVVALRGRVHVARTLKADWAEVGATLDEEFALANQSALPVPWAQIGDTNDLPGYDPRHVVGVPAQGKARWIMQHRCLRRGVYTLGPTHVRLGDPFGLFEVTLTQQDAQPFYVYPPVTTVPLLPQPRMRLHGSARANRRSFAATTNVTGIRFYTAGDPFNHIHWRSTAHRSTPGKDEIMIKEFEPEPLADFWVVLDLDRDVHLGAGDASTEEYAVRLAASLCYQMLRQRWAVGLIAPGAPPIILQPQRGAGQLDQLLRALAGAHADGPTPLAQVLEQHGALMRSGAYCALLTPSHDPAWAMALPRLANRAVQVTAFLLDGRPFGGLSDTRSIAAQLAALGVSSRVVGPDLYAHLNPPPPQTGRARERRVRRADTPGTAQPVTWEWASALGEMGEQNP